MLDCVIFPLAVVALASITWLIVWVSSSRSTEYLGGYVTFVRHYDDWDELVTRTRQVPCGQDKDGNTEYRTETYTEVVYHPEYWTMKTSLDKRERDIDEYMFDWCVERFGVEPEFVPMHRNYHDKDGNAQDYLWSGTKATIIPYTKEHRYRNPFKNSNSLFRYSDITDDEAEKYGLYKYPEIKGFCQDAVVGAEVGEEALNELNYINSVYGAEHQFRVFVLVYPQELGIETVEKQKGYWRGGNKNELVVCLGVDDSNKVKWSGAFSWCDQPWLEVETRSWFSKHDTLDLYSYGLWLEKNVPSKWHRKEFSDFKYVSHSIPRSASLAIFIVSAVLCLGFFVYKLLTSC